MFLAFLIKLVEAYHQHYCVISCWLVFAFMVVEQKQQRRGVVHAA